MNKNRFNFRVWNTIAKAYVDGYIKNNGQFVLDEFSFEEKFGDDWDYITEEENNIVDFCTGLKDKNGKHIYEGDIMEHRIYMGNPELYVVKWSESVNGWVYQDAKNSLKTSYILTEFTDIIIGNIHENPELLKESK